MGDLSTTPANVISSTLQGAERGIAGVTIAAGQPLYKDTNNSNVLKICASNGVAPINVYAGIALHGALVGQPIRFIKEDPDFQPGFTAVMGDPVYISNTGVVGLTKLYSDLATGSLVMCVGIMKSTTKMRLTPTIGGVK